MLNRNVAAVLAITLGIFGTHQFYVGKRFLGLLQFGLFFFSLFASISGAPEELLGMLWTAAALIPFITGIVWMTMPKAKWDEKYNPDHAVDTYQQPLTGGFSPSASGGALKAEGIRYYKSADYDLALEAFAEAIGVDYADPGSHFNLACSYAQLGRYPDAMRHLEISVTLGLPKPERIEKHPALGAMRRLPAFIEFRANNYRQQRHVTHVEAATPFNASINDRKEPAKADMPTKETNEYARPMDNFKEKTSQTTTAKAAPTGKQPATDHNGVDTNGDLLDQISRLRELHDAGILTPREYQLQKERLLG